MVYDNLYIEYKNENQGFICKYFNKRIGLTKLMTKYKFVHDKLLIYTIIVSRCCNLKRSPEVSFTNS